MEGTQLRETQAYGQIERFGQTSPDQFRATINEVWHTGGGKLMDAVADLVEAHTITPVQGLGVMSCVAAQLLSYGAFHGQPTPVDLIAATDGRLRQ